MRAWHWVGESWQIVSAATVCGSLPWNVRSRAHVAAELAADRPARHVPDCAVSMRSLPFAVTRTKDPTLPTVRCHRMRPRGDRYMNVKPYSVPFETVLSRICHYVFRT